jgi:hypothetical protein
MGNIVITLVLETSEDDVTPVVDAAVDAAIGEGYTVTSARVATDTGETTIDLTEVVAEEEPPPPKTEAKGKSNA